MSTTNVKDSRLRPESNRLSGYTEEFDGIIPNSRCPQSIWAKPLLPDNSILLNEARQPLWDFRRYKPNGGESWAATISTTVRKEAEVKFQPLKFFKKFTTDHGYSLFKLK